MAKIQILCVFVISTVALSATSAHGFISPNDSKYVHHPFIELNSLHFSVPYEKNEVELNNCVDPPIINNISGDGLSCDNMMDGDVLIGVSGGTPFAGPYPYLFDWDWDGSPGNDDFSCGCPSGEFEDLSGLAAGIYTVTVTDAAGCTAVESAEVTLPDPPVIDGADFDLQCFGATNGTIDITVTGGIPHPFTGNYDFDWNTDGTGDNDDPEDLSGVGPGTYTVIVTDFLGCTDEAVFTVNEPPELTSSVTASAVQCAGEASGSLDLVVNGGTEPYEFDWDNDGTGDNDDLEDPIDLPAGIYSVTVTDANGCTSEASIEVTEPSLAVHATASGFPTLCFGEPNGNIDLTPSGGTGAYTFDWDNDGIGDNDDPEDLNDVAAGSYSVTVTDANGCSTVASVVIDEPAQLTGNYSEQVCAGGSVEINGTTYDESNASGTEVFTAQTGCDSIVTVTLTFDPPSTGNETYSGCSGDGYSVVVNGTTYNESNPAGTELITTIEGCDSIVIVNLTFQNNSTAEETYMGCTGDGYSIIVNGTVYNESNPSGTEILTNGFGCDSIVTINLSFSQPTSNTISNTGCEGDGYSITVNGIVYDESNPSGTEVITNAMGCDSTVQIDLSFGTPTSSNVNYSGCQGDGYSILVNGIVYNESNPSGTEITSNTAGCDSTITVDLIFNSPVFELINYNGCLGDGYSVIVNGQTYDEDNPIGQELVTGNNGCDSIINIILVFNDEASSEETYTGCVDDGYFVNVNGTIYDQANPIGTEIITGANGCDSIVTINLIYNQETSSFITYTGCTGDGYSVELNGVTYNESNPIGEETIPNNEGCDSVITIDLQYHDVSTEEINYEGCTGDGYSIIVNGVTYDENNQIGVEVLQNENGCDSTIIVDLVFRSVNTNTIAYSGCTGDGFSIQVNGTTYDETLTSGTEFLTTSFGCDSIVEINLDFAQEIYTLLDQAICSGGSLNVGGTIFDASNPSGIVPFEASGGCDSLVEVQLSFLPIPEGNETYNGCSGDGYFVNINGTVYDETNPVGTEIMTAPNGCDSIVQINLTFVEEINTLLDLTLCSGGSINIGGTVFDASNPSGIVPFVASGGCDSLVEVQLSFLPGLAGNETYNGCSGDGYSVTVGNTIYNENNPAGVENLVTATGCDSTVVIQLVFDENPGSEMNLTLCEGESIVVNGTLYDESNPTGTELFAGAGCDSVVVISLSFTPGDTTILNYEGCEGDGYSVAVNGTIYDASNPQGQETFTSHSGCDSIVIIDLDFYSLSVENIIHQGCLGDNYSIDVNGTIYDASNPSGTELFVNQFGCDSLVHIELSFGDTIKTILDYEGCQGDGYFVNVGGEIFNESNPSGQVLFSSNTNCDSLVLVDLIFLQPALSTLSEELCEGGSIVVNGTTYDASNPEGTEVIATGGCDSIVQVSLSFISVYMDTLTYLGCIGDGYEVNVGGVTFSESNPTGEVALQSTLGCDSLVFVDLMYKDCCSPGREFLEATLCTGETFYFNGSIYIASGTYSDTIFNAAGPNCDSIYILDLTISSNPIVDAGSGGIITCSSNAVTLTATTSQDAEIIWSGPGIVGTNNSDLSLTTHSPGWYFVTATNSSGCQDIDSVYVGQESNVPSIIASHDTSLDCANESVTLNVEVTGSNVMVMWTGPGVNNEVNANTQIQVDKPGLYTVMAIDTISNCISITDSVFVEDLAMEVVAQISGEQVLTCRTASTVLNSYASTIGENIEYTWADDKGTFLSNETEVEIMSPGVYYLTVLDTTTSCSDLDSIVILENKQNPIADAVEADPLNCYNEVITVSANEGGNGDQVIYAWTGPVEGITSDPNQLSIEVIQGGTYYLTVTDPLNECVAFDSIVVIESTIAPVAEAGEDQQLTCTQSSVVLQAEGNDPTLNLTYEWNGPGMHSVEYPSIDVENAGIYYLTVQNLENGCSSMDSVFVEEIKGIESALIGFQDSDCSGMDQGYIQVEEVIGGTPPYSYDLSSQPLSLTGEFSALAPGNYTLQITDQYGCGWETNIPIEAGLNLNVDIGPDLILVPGESYQLIADIDGALDHIDSIIWSPPHLLSCTDCVDPLLTAYESHLISVTVISDYGCTSTDSLTVSIDENHFVYIPNVFSPNGDGKNDNFKLFANNKVKKILNMEIYNRWGDKVYAKSDIEISPEDDGWDGTFNGTDVTPSVYIYMFEVELFSGEIIMYSGDVTLLR